MNELLEKQPAAQDWTPSWKPQEATRISAALNLSEAATPDDRISAANVLLQARLPGQPFDPTGASLFSGKTPDPAQFYDQARKLYEIGPESIMTPELNEWLAVQDDEEKALAIARKKRGTFANLADKFGDAVAGPFRPLSDAELAMADDDTKAANAIIRGRRDYEMGATSAYSGRKMPTAEEPAVAPGTPEFDAAAKKVDEHRQNLLDRSAIAEYQSKLFADNIWHQYQLVRGKLDPDTDAIVRDAFTHKTMTPAMADKFRNLKDGDQQRLAASLIYGAKLQGDRQLVWDAVREFGNMAIDVPKDAAESLFVDSIKRLVMDDATYQKQAETLALLEQAESPRMHEYGYWGKSVIGLAGTLPYMAYPILLGNAGTAMIAAKAAKDFEERVAAEGGDVTSAGFQAAKWSSAFAYAAVEKMQALRIGGPITDLQKRQAFLYFWRKANAGIVARTVAGNTITETWEEGVQKGIEDGFVAWGLGEDIARSAATGLVTELKDTAGTMFLTSLTGVGVQAVRGRVTRNHTLNEIVAGSLHASALIDAHKANDAEAVAKHRAALASLSRQVRDAGSPDNAIDQLVRQGVDPVHATMLTVYLQQEAVTIQRDAGLTQAEKDELLGRDRQAVDVMRDLMPDAQIEENYDADGKFDGSFTINRTVAGVQTSTRVTTVDNVEYDLSTPEATASALKRLNENGAEITPEAWKGMSDEEKRGKLTEFGLIKAANFKFDAPSGASVTDGQLKVLTGEIKFSRGMHAATLFHEYFHAMTEYLTQTKALQPADIAKLQEEFGPPAEGVNEQFNEETAADRFRDYAAKKVHFTQSSALEKIWDATVDLLAKAKAMLVKPRQPGTIEDAIFQQVISGEYTGIPVATVARTNPQAQEAATPEPAATQDEPQAETQPTATPAEKPPANANVEPNTRSTTHRVFDGGSPIQSSNPNALRATDKTKAYRLTGQPQIDDILNTGEVRAKEGKIKGGKIGEVHWSSGDENLNYSPQDGRYVIETSIEGLNNRNGGLKASDITHIYRGENGKWVDVTNQIKPTSTSPGGMNFDSIKAKDQKKVEAKEASYDLKPGEWRATTPRGNMVFGGTDGFVDASHLMSSENPAYPAKRQPRDRNNIEARIQHEEIYREMDAQRLFESQETDGGSVITEMETAVDPEDGLQKEIIDSGNGRMNAIKIAIREGTFEEKYGAYARMRAKRMGIDVSGMKYPIYRRRIEWVQKANRRVQPTETDMDSFVELSNVPKILKRNESEMAEADAKMLVAKGLLKLFQPGVAGNIMAVSNAPFMVAFVRAAGASDLVNSDGHPTDLAERRVKRALLALLIGEGKTSREIIRAMTENAQEMGMGTVVDGVLKSIGDIVGISQAKPTLSIVDATGMALRDYLEMKIAGYTSAQDWVNQGDFFNPRPEAVKSLVQAFHARANTSVGIASIFRDYAAKARLVDTSTESLGMAEADTMQSILDRAIADTAKEAQADAKAQAGPTPADSDKATVPPPPPVAKRQEEAKKHAKPEIRTDQKDYGVEAMLAQIDANVAPAPGNDGTRPRLTFDRTGPLSRELAAAVLKSREGQGAMEEGELKAAISRNDPLLPYHVLHYWNTIGFTEIADDANPEITQAFEDALARIPPTSLHGMTLYRFQGYQSAQARASYLKGIKPGGYVEIKRPTNAFSRHTDYGQEMADAYGGRFVVQFVVESPRQGRDPGQLLYGSKPGGEYLYRRGDRFRVASVENGENGAKVVRLEESSRVGTKPAGRFSFDKPVAPAFYSQLRRVIEQKVPNRATVAQIRATIDPAKGSGVKQDEIFWSGLGEWLDSKKPTDMVTKEEVLAATMEVVVTDVVKDGDLPTQFAEFTDTELERRLVAEGEEREAVAEMGREEIISRLREIDNEKMADTSRAKFESYQLPGGENYRELLLTLPHVEERTQRPSVQKVTKELFPDKEWMDLTVAERTLVHETQQERDRAWREKAIPHDDFTSSHFSEPNIIAHVRFNERTSADGKRTLFIEEIQSDWAQKGKKEGFRGSLPPVSQDETGKWIVKDSNGVPSSRHSTKQNAENERNRILSIYNEYEIGGIPSGPYVTKTDAWVSLALKRMVRWAAENGFEQVAWTTGEQQAERYDLSKQISRIEYIPDFRGEGVGSLVAFDLNGNDVIRQNSTPEKLQDYIGKDAAKKLVDSPIKKLKSTPAYSGHTISGLDLKVGGEGMKAFYDQIVPTTANKLFKRFGAKAGETTIGDGTGEWYVYDGNTRLAGPFDTKAEATEANESLYGGNNEVNTTRDNKGGEGPQTVHALPITPEMRESVMTEGQARFSFEKVRPSLSPNNTAIASLAVQKLAGKEIGTEQAARAMYLFKPQGATAEQLLADANRMADSAVGQAAKKALEGKDPTKALTIIATAAETDSLVAARSGAIEGAKTALRMGRMAARGEAAALKQLLIAAKGENLQQFEIDTGISWTETLLSFLPEQWKKWEDDAKKDDKPEGPEKTENEAQAIPPTPEELAEREKRGMQLLEAARAWDADRRAKLEKEQADKKPEAEGAGGETENIDAEQAAIPAIPKELLEAHGVDLTSPEAIAHAIRLWIGDWIVRNSNGRLTHATVWLDPEAVESYRKTIRQQLEDMANKLLDPSDSGPVWVARMIGDLPTTGRPDTFERRSAMIIASIQAHAIRQSRRDLVIGIRKTIDRLGKQGKKFDPMEEDLKRKIGAEPEQLALYIKKAIGWGADKCSEELEKLQASIAGRQKLYDDDHGNLDADYDIQLHYDQIKLALLTRWGNLKSMLPAEIKAAGDEITQWLSSEQDRLGKEWFRQAEANGNMMSAILEGLVPVDTKKAKMEPGAVQEFMEAHTYMVRQRLEALLRHGDPAKRAAAMSAIEEVMFQMSKGTEVYEATRIRYRKEWEAAVMDVTKDRNGKVDRKAAAAWLKHLDEPIPAEVSAKISRQGYAGTMTYGQAIQLYASLTQRYYAQNVLFHKRNDHAKMIEGILSPADIKMVYRMRDIYEKRRAELSAVVRKVTGLDVWRPDPLYMPVQMYLGSKGGLGSTGNVRAWRSLADTMTPRVRNNRDFDESVDIQSMFFQRMEDTARAIGYGARGLTIRGVIGKKQLHDTIERYYGKQPVRELMKHVTQALTGVERHGDNKIEQMLAFGRKLNTYMALSYNILSFAKQIGSFPAFMFEMGGGSFVTAISQYDGASWAELKDSDGYKARYMGGIAPEVMEILDDPSQNVIARAYKAGMVTVQAGDYIAAKIVATGIYKAKTAEFMKRPGMTLQQAKERAKTETWALVERTQQSGRTENVAGVYRNYGEMAKLVFQFASAPLMQLSHEFHAAMDAKAGVAGAKERLTRAILLNHLIIPGIMSAIEFAFNSLLLGREPPEDKDTILEIVAYNLMFGPLSRILIVGSMAEAIGDAATGNLPKWGRAIPAETGYQTAAYVVRAMTYDLLTADIEQFQSDILEAAKKASAPIRHISTFYENQIAQ